MHFTYFLNKITFIKKIKENVFSFFLYRNVVLMIMIDKYLLAVGCLLLLV